MPETERKNISQPYWKSLHEAAKPEFTKKEEFRVVKVDAGVVKRVVEYSAPKIHENGRGEYHTTKNQHHVQSVTDFADRAVGPKDPNFELSPVVQEALGIHRHDEKVVAKLVDERVAEIQAKAWEEAQAQGYQAGLEKGYQEAFNRFKEEADERLQAFEAMVANFEKAKAEIFAAHEKVVVESIYQVARFLALKEIATDKEYVIRLAKKLIESTPIRDHIRVKVHPEDAQTLGMIKEGLEAQIKGLTNLSIETSTEIGRGGCEVETQWAVIDATLATQLKRIREGLLGGEKSA